MDSATAQVKFAIDSGIVSAFKARCAEEGVSMASAVRRFMEACRPAKEAKRQTLTRPLRRKATADIIAALADIMDAEASYMGNIPEQFEQRHEAAEHACGQLEEAISILEDAFQ
jgi:hypothetical protein